MSDELRLLREQGWCVLKGIVPDDRARELRTTLNGILGNYGCIAPSVTEKAPLPPVTLRASVIREAPDLASYVADPRVIELLESAAGGLVAATSVTSWAHEPDDPAGPWHTGEPFDSASTSGSVHFLTYWMFSAFRPDNGLAVRPAGGGEPCIITGRPGDVAVLDSRLQRSCIANTSALMRFSVVAGYAPAGSGPVPKDEKAAISRSAFERLPDAAKPLFRHWVE